MQVFTVISHFVNCRPTPNHSTTTLIYTALIAGLCSIQAAHSAWQAEESNNSIFSGAKQADPDEDSGNYQPSYANPIISKWKAGVTVVGSASDCYNVFISIPVPKEWPEQKVTVVEEEIPGNIGQVRYRQIEGGVMQLIVQIPLLPAGQEITISKTYRVATSESIGPQSTSGLLRPSTTHKEAKGHLGSSKEINFNDGRMRTQLREIVDGKSTPWKEIEAIYDWVRDNIDQKEMANYDTKRAFRQRACSEDDKVGLFIAFCRLHKIPARYVWVDGSSYAEFMLVDDQDNAIWYPCNVTGLREFGSYSEPKVILQKGDNLRVPEKKERQRLVAEFVSIDGTSKPSVSFIRDLLPADD